MVYFDWSIACATSLTDASLQASDDIRVCRDMVDRHPVRIGANGLSISDVRESKYAQEARALSAFIPQAQTILRPEPGAYLRSGTFVFTRQSAHQTPPPDMVETSNFSTPLGSEFVILGQAAHLSVVPCDDLDIRVIF
jgi:hypothetical protein